MNRLKRRLADSSDDPVPNDDDDNDNDNDNDDDDDMTMTMTTTTTTVLVLDDDNVRGSALRVIWFSLERSTTPDT
jgi:hypothetical protein